MRRMTLSALLLVLLSACAPMRWEKPDTISDIANQDLSECRESARLRAFREGPHFYYGFGPPYLVCDRRGRAYFYRPYYPDSDRFLREHSLTNLCMQEKGYKLVPIKPDN